MKLSGMLAILTKTGLGMKRTLLLNLIPGFLSYFGFMIGATLGRSFDRSDQFVFAVSSGMYLYVLLGTLVCIFSLIFLFNKFS